MADLEESIYSNVSDLGTTNGYEEKNGTSHHSRHSSQSSGLSTGNKENLTATNSSSTADSSSEQDLILLQRGGELLEESRTESYYENQKVSYNGTKSGQSGNESSMTPQYSGGTAKARAAKSPYTAGPVSAIPEEQITIPNDGNISAFTADQLSNFLRCLKIDDRIISHLHRKNVDGKRFAKLKDSELESLGVSQNAVVLFFREKSEIKKGKSNRRHFML
ncbi:uncharacterized protein LOC106012780 [Aplysia californica]|uniref:Uncharacterized protein LOC106012780 n=1 Tax=Aplysia californica TaxID=6500 RepID=A0ABM1A760_APLCA|nr:uncharacterized protein LOC106012780 [Aplysia californica]